MEAEPTVVSLMIDGAPVEANNGTLLLHVLSHRGIELPHVCYHAALGPLQTCDTCMVDIGGELSRACATPVQRGLEVWTTSNRARSARFEATQRLLRNHELACTVCDNNNGDCALHNAVDVLQIEQQAYAYAPKPYPVDESHPFYAYNPDQCILCGRCVEVCQDVQVNETLSIDWHLDRPRVIWDDHVPINQSSCVACGQCVTVCPVDALQEKSMRGQAGFLTGMPDATRRKLLNWTKAVEPGFGPLMAVSNVEAAMRASRIAKTKTVCTYCGVGCAFDVWTRGRHILKVNPQAESPANGISTCVKGKFGWDFVNSRERLTRPLLREAAGHFREVSWDAALVRVAQGFSTLKQAWGPDTLAVIGSSKCTNEEAYLTQKLARQVLGTNNVDNCSRYCQAPATAGLWRTVGYGGDSGSMSDIEQADVVLIVGSNTAESHPVLASKIKRAQKLRGQKLIVADLRRHEMAERADLFLHPRPGTDLVWLSAVARFIVDHHWMDPDFIRTRVNNFEAYRESLQPFSLAYAAEVCGIAEADLVQVATMIHEGSRVCALWAMGVTQHQGGSDTSTAIANLMLLTGNFGRSGTGAYPLRGHNNVQGTSDFGCMPNYFPGYQPVQDPAVRARFEAAWHTRLPADPGLDNHQMIDAIHQGRLKGLYVIGEDLSLVDAHSSYVQEALERIDFLVVQDLFLSGTAQYADVVLPASPSLEKEGTFTNTERRIQRLYQVLAPLGDSRPDWIILQSVASALGISWGYRHPSEIMEEASRLAPLFAGVHYARLEGYQSLQWPVDANGADSPLLYREQFNFADHKAQFYPLTWQEPLHTDDTYDLLINNGRLLEHFHEGNLTYQSPGIREKAPGTFLEISPELARARSLETGDWVRLVSRWGSLKVAVLVTDRVAGHELYLPMNDRGWAAVNRLTSDLVDRATNTPAFKELPVRMEVMEGHGQSPLPAVNHRYGRRHPQIGVRVEDKWRRPDYRRPSEPQPEGGL